MGIDSHQVMDLFVLDTKLNISRAYLRPGFAFGGSCLPKDLRALLHKSKELDLTLPVLGSVLESNRLHVQRAFDLVASTGTKRIGILGLSFKEGTDDLRESPTVSLVENLIGKGYEVKIFDPEVAMARIFGANKEYIEREIPHISDLMKTDLESVVKESEVIVISNKSEEYRHIGNSLRSDQTVIDLVRLFDSPPPVGSYSGIGW
jgi:GDP-mannose 6-dehydrogenase